ncbi:uncharacterized protein LOC143072861 [Mytilus galloprovincialis]|uniref:uncharacterized protein LOC143072861 n=1 Tax=Mytilus galloprovincialis TaxID=29158 RepID=UPI003F7C26A1
MDVNVMPVDDFSPPDICGDERCRDYFMEFVYCFIIPGGIVLLLTMIITVSILCTCCKRQEKPVEEYEMECYNTIRRASQSLRDLSHKRDTLLEPRSGSLSLPRNGSSSRSRRTCYSAPNTLQRDRRRHQREETHSLSPPSYQNPPAYSYVSDLFGSESNELNQPSMPTHYKYDL